MFASAAFGVSPLKWHEAANRVGRAVISGDVAAATLYLQSGGEIYRYAFGRATDENAVFLIASITKPMTAAAIMVLVDRGQLSLTDPVQRYIPEFKGNGRERIQLRHVLTHTSGLPDMLPENDELRKRHAPLPEFVTGTVRTPLLFTPGSKVSYQSMGILLAAEIASRVAKQPFPAFLEEVVFRPLGMKNTSLGLGGREISQTMPSQVDVVNDWDWNSHYWRSLAAPWGGAHSTGPDIARFLRYFDKPDGRVMKPELAANMVRPQTGGLKPPYGYGFRLNENGSLGRGLSSEAYGHGGSTGTLCWHDPKKDLTFVLLTTKPAEHSNKTLLHPVSDMVAGGG